MILGRVAHSPALLEERELRLGSCWEGRCSAFTPAARKGTGALWRIFPVCLLLGDAERRRLRALGCPESLEVVLCSSLRG